VEKWKNSFPGFSPRHDPWIILWDKAISVGYYAVYATQYIVPKWTILRFDAGLLISNGATVASIIEIDDLVWDVP
jgi:hypothetical protein